MPSALKPFVISAGIWRRFLLDMEAMFRKMENPTAFGSIKVSDLIIRFSSIMHGFDLQEVAKHYFLLLIRFPAFENTPHAMRT